MRFGILLLFMCAAAQAHVISMSYGFATVSANRVDYILRMPDYEVQRGLDPARVLLDRIVFSSGFQTARRTEGECQHDPAHSTYLCAATYVFEAPIGAEVDVDCRFSTVTVPNHIHMLHAERAGRTDQAILDASFPSARLLFRPPTAFETASMQVIAAAKRTITTWAQLLLLVAIVLASRTSLELLWCGLAFTTAECIACLLIVSSKWQVPPGFAESAVAVAIGYLGFEMLIFPEGRGRWLLAAVFGAFTGTWYSAFISESGFAAKWVLAGSAGTVLLCILLLLPGFRIRFPRRQLSRVASVPLLLTGVIWFVVRLRG